MVTAIAKAVLWTVKTLMLLGLIQWVAPDLSYQIGYITSEFTVGWLG